MGLPDAYRKKSKAAVSNEVSLASPESTMLLNLHNKRSNASCKNYRNIIFLREVYNRIALENFCNNTVDMKILINDMIQNRSYKISDNVTEYVNLFELAAYYGQNNLLELLGHYLLQLHPELIHIYSRNALCYAVCGGQLAIIYMLLDQFKMDPNTEIVSLRNDWYTNCPTLMIFLRNHFFLNSLKDNVILELINALIDAGINLNYISNEGHSYLSYAVISKKFFIFKEFLQRGIDPNAVQRIPETGEVISTHDIISGFSFTKKTRDQYLQLLVGYGGKPATGARASSAVYGNTLKTTRKRESKLMIKRSHIGAYSQYEKIVRKYNSNHDLNPVIEYLEQYPFLINRYVPCYFKPGRNMLSLEAPIFLHACIFKHVNDVMELIRRFNCDLTCASYIENVNKKFSAASGVTIWHLIDGLLTETWQLTTLLSCTSVDSLYYDNPYCNSDITGSFLTFKTDDLVATYLQSEHCLQVPDRRANVLHDAVKLYVDKEINLEKFDFIINKLPPEVVVRFCGSVDKHGHTPLILAIRAEAKPLIIRLLKSGGPVIANFKDAVTCVRRASSSRDAMETMIREHLTRSSKNTSTRGNSDIYDITSPKVASSAKLTM